MNYASVCSGIEAASVAWEPLGWKPVLFSEIEPFPIAVLKHHYPDVPVHGDFTTLIDDPPMCDLLCGGTPCQAFSVAGLRQSLDDDRGNLTLSFVKLADAIDHLRSTHGHGPAWVLWENVPGVLNTKDNAFGAFLGGLCGRSAPIPQPEGGWTGAGVVDGPSRVAAWRTLDAQHFGLAQRRKRVFVLAKGGPRRWGAADALLPLIESSQWHTAPGRETGEGTAADVVPSLTAIGRGVERTGESRGQDPVVAVEVTHTLKGEGFDASEDGTGRGVPLVLAHGQGHAEHVRDGDPSLTCNHEAPILVRMREGKEGGGKGPLVSEDKSLTLATANDQILAFRHWASVADTGLPQEDMAPALRSADSNGIAVAYPLQEVNVSRANLKGTGAGIGQEGDPMFTIGAAQPHGVVAFDTQQITSKVNRTRVEPGLPASTLSTHGSMHASIGMQVRRLTPRECERLQGFPDDWTLVPYRNKPAADGPRYTAVGNSWATHCARYIGEQIQRVENEQHAAA
jgi:DNA (cytosine-5)-methyltransferase 1